MDAVVTETERILAGGGEMGERMRVLDWSQTPLGPVETWPPALRTTVSMMLASPYPIVLFWGAELVHLYNDGVRPLIGAKHPVSLGVPAQRSYAEVWDVLGPMFDSVTGTGTRVYMESQPLFLDRQGFLEEAYFTWSYIPTRDEHGRIVCVLTIGNETTRQVLGERRFKCLRELSIRTALAQDTQGVLSAAQEVLAQSGPDVPFALLYRVDGEHVRLNLRAGLEEGARLAPGEFGLGEAAPWPLAEVLRSREARLLEDVGARAADVHAGPWPEPVRRAWLLPLSLEGHQAPDAVLVVGLSPRLPLDENYRDFLQLLARQLAADVARTRALEQEKQRAAQLAEMDRVKTAFFSNVSHEFRTPLTLMLGPTENALASPERALRGEELERVHRNELRLLKLVNTLLDLSRLEAGRTQGRFMPTNLAPLTAGLASAFESIMVKAGLRLVVDCPALPERVWVDPDLWEKVVLNLVSNAFKYTLQGAITVRLRWRGDQVELSVQDTGTGIPVEQQGRIFERFHRVEGARGRSDEGTGIGLSLVRELVELHGGHVRVDSVPGQGSTFTVAIPTGQAHLPPERVIQEPPRVSTALGSKAFLQEAEQWLETGEQETGEQETGELAESAPTGQALLGRVLLADDNADMRDYIARLLRTRFHVETVADGQAALEAARARPPDVVLSDVMMPRLDGFGLARALKADAATAHLSILLISARASEKATLEGFEAGGVDYLVKPFRARELLARVEAAVRAAQARSERERLLQEVQAARERLRERVEFEQQLLGIVSRDLRDPLGTILQGTSSLSKLEDLDERAVKPLVRIRSAAEHATRMAKDLLDFTEAQFQGSLDISPHPMDLHEVTSIVLDSLEDTWPTREVEMRHEGNSEMKGDAQRMGQVVRNLVTNALKYSPGDSRVQVGIRGEAKTVSLSVTNQGTPIPRDKLANIFEPMQRALAEPDPESRSVGLGLYIVKRIVDAHGGRIEVTSTPQEGTRFTVRLPREASPTPGAHR